MAEPALQQAPANDGPAAPAVEATLPGPGSKRQRRPSVRLGDIGEQPAAIPHEPFVRRSKHWKHSAAAGRDHPRHPHVSKALSGLLPGTAVFRRGQRGAPPRRREPRASFSRGKAVPRREGPEERRRRGRGQAGESPSDRREAAAAFRVRVPETEDMGHDGDAPEGDAPSENDGGDWNDQNGRCGLLEDGGVRTWLSRLGLDRYTPLFEIHEVDDEVLPLLTMEDLKDMGINAIGSRRKMYCAIQKLKK
ncbi:unnamed protein product, partial [Musa acuminata subsp. burmannicoides]